jgi:hemoglobin
MSVTMSLNEAGIATLVDRFYAKVRQDRLLGPVFNQAIGDHWPEHLRTLTDFWSSILLASGRYKGNPMQAHLELPQMDRQHFEQWLKLWAETTDEVFGAEISAALVTKAKFMGERLLSMRAGEAT